MTKYHFKDEIQTYLERECKKQAEVIRLINVVPKNMDKISAFSISSVNFKRELLKNKNNERTIN